MPEASISQNLSEHFLLSVLYSSAGGPESCNSIWYPIGLSAKEARVAAQNNQTTRDQTQVSNLLYRPLFNICHSELNHPPISGGVS